jgi:eukaryotic-like serine/threonine-protein kinase
MSAPESLPPSASLTPVSGPAATRPGEPGPTPAPDTVAPSSVADSDPTAPEAGPPPPRPPAAPASGRYSLRGEVGRGGMGVVLAAHDPALNRDLALKVLRGEHAGQPEVEQRFREEAQIGGQLQHPGVVPVYELGSFDDGRAYFTMKLVKGATLAHLLRQRPDPSQDRPRFLKIFEQVCQAVAYAHSKRVIHRDLKPANVMVGAFGEVQVMEWGLVKVLANEDGLPPEDATPPGGTDPLTANATQSGTVVGPPGYMAPEQARGETGRLDERCDVFGLGALLCEILSAEPPLRGGAGHSE